mmetsp:Transcript_18118/g.21707  ORF Transcript_18118/g.21707 Transcript_18118/m.21707 type:complete len:806 (-) Transcript_18118:478-2895(-)|eukprot:CAMPEP_0197846534 /NCGR_PEP_ID=MMETSP1438-20131217/3388_1 /TAXON_ID=1461541 /ORGANISM="Pterosperma sp., Strain CCMP1384" /LENGTH=805 /DNA_ID=CAMNT_0043458217 /DNA_START=104 /DNA_END=2521 /DNA_ORIENTATION=+
MAFGSVLIILCSFVGMAFAAFLQSKLKQVSLHKDSYEDVGEGFVLEGLVNNAEEGNAGGMKAAFQKLRQIYRDIQDGAKAFLFAEYKMCAAFLIVFGFLVMLLVSHVEGEWDFTVGTLTAISFVVGGVTSMASGYLGMMVAVYGNARTTVCATETPDSAAWTASFNCAFRAGGVMGFALTGLALLVLYILMYFYSTVFDYKTDALKLFECVAGFGLGGSSIALFGRVGGGIYTKAADVGADLAGKVVAGIPEDDPRNPATIADNVGDNVGDVAGMGSDLFGSFGEASCAALVIAAQSTDLIEGGWDSLCFPLTISAVGILVCLVTSFVATDVSPVKCEADVEKVLKIQMGLSTLLMTIVMYPLCAMFLPGSVHMGSGAYELACVGALAESSKCVGNAPQAAFFCVSAGLWGGCIIGFVTEYFTSHSYTPVREVARSTETGAATNIIYGLALGYKSTIIPVGILAGIVYISFTFMDMYGVALAALGMLGTLATCLSIDVYGPVCDNAGGIAEMAELPEAVREKTDALDAAGNTTAAIGKGFAIGSAALVALALTSAFVSRSKVLESGVNMLQPITFAFLLIGSMLPYWFSAMTMKSVGLAAMEMVKEVKRQFETIPGLLEGTPGHGPPDHAKCIKISTDASLKEMVAPGLLVMCSPILAGTIFGVQAVVGLLAGGLVSGVQLAISASNTGGAWDNAKKYVEKGELYITVARRHPAAGDPEGGPYTGDFVRGKDGMIETMSVKQKKGSECHKAAVIGDTVGDPLKDTSGPALNILMKLMAIISLVFCDFFMSINNGQGYLNVAREAL